MSILLKGSGNSRARDPWVIYYGGFYYYVFACDGSICISRAENLSGLINAEEVVVYTPEPGKEYSCELWAPELHIINGKCYIYVACDNGNNYNHRMFVLENGSSDPLKKYVIHGKIADSSDCWAIDGTVFEFENKLWFVWSGWEGKNNVSQSIFIAEMSDPFTTSGDRVMISTPEYDWEKRGATGKEGSPFINEGPCALINGNKLFLLYSASGSWCKDYCIGMLTYTGGGLLNADNWKKTPGPVLAGGKNGEGPGHCSVLKDKNGENIICYHVFDKEKRCEWNNVNAVAQKFTFDRNGFPVFGGVEKID